MATRSTAYTGSHNLTFSGAGAVGTNNPTVTNSSGAAVNFGTATAITFTNGVATVSGSNNGVMRLYKAETANITVSEGGSYTSSLAAVTVSPLAISKPLARRRHHDSERRRGRQPDDHRHGHLRQHGDRLHRLAQPDLLRRRARSAPTTRPSSDSSGAAANFGTATRDHLHQRRRPRSPGRITA